MLRASHLAQLRAIVDDPEASANDRFVATDLLAQRLRVRRRGAADVPGHRHGDRRRQAHRDGADRRERRGGDLPRGLRGLRRAEPALLADGAHVVLGRAQHRHEPARAGRAVQRAGRHPALRAAGDGQGRRVGEQDLPLPGDEGAAEPEAAGGVPRREAALAGHGRVPALPPGDRRRRDVGGVHAQGREAGVGALPRHAARLRVRAGPRVPRPRPRAAGAGAHARVRDRRAVRRQVLLPRRAGDPPAPARGVAAGGHRRVVLGGPAGQGQDHARGRVPGAARARPRAVPAGRHGRASRSTRATSCAST